MELNQNQVNWAKESEVSKNGKGKGFGSEKRTSHSFDVTEPTEAIQRIEELDPQQRNGDATIQQVNREMAAVVEAESEGRIQANRKAEAYIKGMADQDALNQKTIAEKVAQLDANRKQLMELAHSTTGSQSITGSSTLENFGSLDMEALKRQILAAKAAPKN